MICKHNRYGPSDGPSDGGGGGSGGASDLNQNKLAALQLQSAEALSGSRRTVQQHPLGTPEARTSVPYLPAYLSIYLNIYLIDDLSI